MDNYVFLYTVDPSAEEPIMLINKHIGFDEQLGYGIMGEIFQKELMVLDTMDKKSIKVYINSPGGIVTDGYNIYSAILKTKTKVDTYNIGMAASIAGVIFQAGRTRYMADYSKLMYHNPYNDDGSTDKSLEPLRDSLAIMIAKRTGKDVDIIKRMMARTTWIGADEALDNGFCDVIENSDQLNKKRTINNAEEAKAFYREAEKIMNNLFSTKNNISMTTELTKINNRLGLNPEASVDSTMQAIEKVLNKAEEDKKEKAKAEEDMDGLKKALKKAEEDRTKAEEDCKSLKDKIKKMEEDKAEEDKKAKAKAEEDAAAKAKNLVEGYVKDGRIKNDSAIITTWTEKAKIDFDGVKNMLESLPLNKNAAKIPQTQGGDTKEVGSVIAMTMANAKAKALAKELEIAK